jgi:hypothetical protein
MKVLWVSGNPFRVGQYAFQASKINNILEYAEFDP